MKIFTIVYEDRHGIRALERVEAATVADARAKFLAAGPLAADATILRIAAE